MSSTQTHTNHEKASKSTKSTKKHGLFFGGGRRERQPQRKIIKHQKSRMVVLLGACWCFVIHANTHQPRKGTKKHKEARILGGGEGEADTGADSEIRWVRRDKTCTEKHRGSRSVRQSHLQETAEDIQR